MFLYNNYCTCNIDALSRHLARLCYMYVFFLYILLNLVYLFAVLLLLPCDTWRMVNKDY